MIEPYVENVMDIVTKACKARGIPEYYIWDWLGGVKLKEDNGNLTLERADFIGRYINDLLDEWEDEQDEKMNR